jgi:hypothetical protein
MAAVSSDDVLFSTAPHPQSPDGSGTLLHYDGVAWSPVRQPDIVKDVITDSYITADHVFIDGLDGGIAWLDRSANSF